MRRYLKFEWHHDHDDYPVLRYSEIGDGGEELREELRKVDVYSDGHLDFADSVRSTGSTLLSEKPMLGLDKIAAQPEFRTRLRQRNSRRSRERLLDDS